MLIAFDWRLGLLSLIPVVAAFLIMGSMTGQRMKDKMTEYQNALEEMSSEAVEYVRGIPVVKTFGQSVFSFKRFQASIKNYEKWTIAYTKEMRLPMVFYTTAINAVFAVLIAATFWFAGDGGDNRFLLNLLFYIIITPIITVTLNKMMYSSENQMVVEDALARVDGILERKPLEESVNVKELEDTSIAFEHVSFRYENAAKDAIKDINLTIKEGEHVAFVGPPGGGKTTLASLAARFYDATEGEIRIGNVDVKDISSERLMEMVSFVFQDSKLLKMSILDNVRMGRKNASREEVLQALKDAQCEDILAKLPNGIDTVIGTQGTYVSGGEAQRLSIARAMLKNAPILILIGITTYIQYNATFLATYVESGVRRVSLAEQLRKIPLSFFGKKDLADLTSTIMSDCATMETTSSHWIPELIGACISTAIVAISLFFFDWRMAIAALWVLPIAFAIVLCSGNVQRVLSNKHMQLKMECADGIQECLESVRDLRANNAQDTYMEGLDKKIKAVEKHAITTELGTAVFVASAQKILKFGIATVALMGGMLLAKGEITVLTFFMFLLLVSRLYDSMQISLQNLAAIISTDVLCGRMDEILSHEVQTGVSEMDNQGYDIAFTNVGFAYDAQHTVLKDVTFTAKQGEVTALIGPSGGGKTTISRLASRFWDTENGKITVGGMDISKIDPETLMSLYSIVFQDVTLFNNTIMENIRIGKQNATDEEVIAAARLAHCEEFVEKMPDGWQTMIGENGSELSGGERQRISIARTFLKDAPIILLDEATASLDVDNETLIQEALSRLIQNKTVMIIAHCMRTVADADKIVVLKDGVVAEQGTPEELEKKKGIYCHMKETQMQAAGWQL